MKLIAAVIAVLAATVAVLAQVGPFLTEWTKVLDVLKLKFEIEV